MAERYVVVHQNLSSGETEFTYVDANSEREASMKVWPQFDDKEWIWCFTDLVSNYIDSYF